MVMEVEVKGVRQVSKEGEEGKEREEGPTPRVMEELRVDHTGEKQPINTPKQPINTPRVMEELRVDHTGEKRRRGGVRTSCLLWRGCGVACAAVHESSV